MNCCSRDRPYSVFIKKYFASNQNMILENNKSFPASPVGKIQFHCCGQLHTKNHNSELKTSTKKACFSHMYTSSTQTFNGIKIIMMLTNFIGATTKSLGAKISIPAVAGGRVQQAHVGGRVVVRQHYVDAGTSAYYFSGLSVIHFP